MYPFTVFFYFMHGPEERTGNIGNEACRALEPIKKYRKTKVFTVWESLPDFSKRQ